MNSDGQPKAAEKSIVPLFKTMHEPTVEQVGQLIDLKCGHTQRPTDLETTMFTVHLEAAGFMKGKGSIGSPQRTILNTNSISPSGANSNNQHSSKSIKYNSSREGQYQNRNSGASSNQAILLVKIKTPMPGPQGANSYIDGKKSRKRSQTISSNQHFDESSRKKLLNEFEDAAMPSGSTAAVQGLSG